MWIKVLSGLLLVNVGLVCCTLKEVVDLTWEFSNDTIYWPGITPFSYTKVVENEQKRGYWYAMKEFCAGEHGGTHFDAPYHFNKEGWKVGEVPINRLLAKGAVIDLSRKNSTNLLPQHLDDWVHTNGEFENNTVILVKFGWSKFWPNKNEYMGLDENGNLNFPGVSIDAATWIANSGKIVGVGLDTPSVDSGARQDMMAHRILSKNQIYNMENVKLLVDLPAKGFYIIAAPMKLKEGTGAPLRIFAIPKGFL